MSTDAIIVKAPFPYFGGKSRIAAEVWRRFGNVPNFVEPFCGSLAVLLARPEPFTGSETVNDACGFISNFWRAVQSQPKSVAQFADNPVNENDLHARHSWLVGQKESLQARLEGDMEFCDPKIAGWWCWGICCWIGGGFCSGEGPWQVRDGELVRIGNAGQGVNRQRVHLHAGRGVNRQLDITAWMQALADRLARVRVCCGDWSRICGDTPTIKQGLTAVFLDPPYSTEAGRDNDLYCRESASVAHDCRAWAIERSGNPLFRIALCGYESEHAMPDDWECLEWKTQGGYGSQGDHGNENAKRERIWFSPACLRVERDRQTELF